MSAIALKNNPTVLVESDGITLGFQAALARVEKVYSKPIKTLIDTISDKDWNELDASDEAMLVADKDGLPPIDFDD